MYTFEQIIEEIENNLTNVIDVQALAQKANMSVYEFRRIFSFVAQISFGEYVRKRRLSLAALELYNGGISITDLSLKYGYDSPSSFSRAFKEFHGITPSDVTNGNNTFKLLTKISTEITTSGGEDIAYYISQKDEFTISGFFEKSTMSDTECCEDVWNQFYLADCAKEISQNNQNIYAVYENGGDFVNCYIGEMGEHYQNRIFIPATEWACFKLRGTDDRYVNEFYKNVLNHWFSSVGYVKNNAIPNIEVFPADMSTDNFEWEIWIPILKGDAII